MKDRRSVAVMIFTYLSFDPSDQVAYLSSRVAELVLQAPAIPGLLFLT